MSPSPVTTWEDLPVDCWETVFGRVDDHEPLSLVNKRFRTITSLARTSLSLPYTNSPFYPINLHTRFPNLTDLYLGRILPDFDAFVRRLAASFLPLRSLRLAGQPGFPRDAMRLLGCSSASKTLRDLSCTRFNRLDDDDLLVVADCFSYLHRLELHHSLFADGKHTITDRGILAISIKLKSLVSLVICCNEHVSELSFHYLSTNCRLLSDLKIRNSDKSLVSIDYFHSFTFLSSLCFKSVNVSESGLLQLSRANLKIRKLVLRGPEPRLVNGAALCRFLASCLSLHHLVLKFAQISNDATALDFVASIPNVNYLHITHVDLITPTILFDLLEGCPNLMDVALKMNSVEIAKYSSDNLPLHPRLRKLFLTGWGLNDEIIMLIGSICPNLESLFVNYNSEVTDRGMKAVKASCCNVKLFDTTGFEHVRTRHKNYR